jgi:hypothetical protein
MSVRLDELFRVKTNSTPITEIAEYSINNTEMGYSRNSNLYSGSNALDHLFSEIARKNLSWDTLLTGKSYRAFYVQSQQVYFSDFGFLAGIVPSIASGDGVYTKGTAPAPVKGAIPYRDVTFAENDPRIAGAITTSRFFVRYTNTGVNKNRRRAAAIFRIFLCDSMSAAVSSSEGQDEHILDLMFPHTPGMSEDQIRGKLADAETLHGTQPDCMACHYKLDPMGKTLLTSQSALSPTASKGHLTYKKSGGSLVNVPVRGVGELGSAIVLQDEYKSCQVRHFWNWFIEDATLTAEREKELVKKFDQVGHRTNDFIKYLIAQKEFFSVRVPLTEDQSMARQVKAYLQKCQNCHKDQTYDESPDLSFPDFTKWPIGGDAISMQDWIAKISKNLDLAHDGENPRMPPSIASWRSSFKETQLIKSWIQKGAPDENGKRTAGGGGQ